jgi:hypothetical protein
MLVGIAFWSNVRLKSENREFKKKGKKRKKKKNKYVG